MVTGTIIMWVGFLFFNGGIMFAPRQATSAKVFHNTFLAGAASFWTGLIMKGLLMKSFRRRTWYDC
jgi:ammonia channel protein AmtB